MAMKVSTVKEQDKAGVPVKFVPAEMLEQRKSEIRNMIARRAYELFRYRGRGPGHEIDDWVQAESELLYPCHHDLTESTEAIILQADLPGSFTAHQLTVSVEPRRLVVSGEGEISVLYGDASDAHWEVRSQQIFQVHDLPVDVDPSKATAKLNGDAVEIVLPKASSANQRSKRARSASSGR